MPNSEPSIIPSSSNSSKDKSLYNPNVQALIKLLDKSDVEYVCLEALKTILMHEFTSNVLTRRDGQIGINSICGNISVSKEIKLLLCDIFENPELYELGSRPIFYVVHVPFDKLVSDNLHALSKLCELNDLEIKFMPSWQGCLSRVAVCIYRLESLDMFKESLVSNNRSHEAV